jgi:hypothetical protein
MKIINKIILCGFLITAYACLWPSTATAAEAHAHHTTHNMFMYGENEIFISHLVYKAPHNYQIVLRVKLPAEARSAYLKTRRAHPKDMIVLLLNTMDISKIADAKELSGLLQHVDSSGKRVQIAPEVKLSSDDFSLIFFNELPLSLTAS